MSTRIDTTSATSSDSTTNHAASLAARLKDVLQHPWLESMMRFSALEDTLTALHPLLSLSEVRARVVRIIDETATTKTFVLQTNALWHPASASAGQFVRLRLEIDGRRVERVYSLSSRPGARRIAITVKRQDNGLVSNHLHNNIKVGSVLTISQAAGQFVLPPTLPGAILLLSAGSGITPVMAMLRDLAARRYAGNLVFLHVCRNADDLIFSAALRALAADFPALKLITHFDDTAGRFTMQTLQACVPDLSQRATWLCGPGGFMDAVHQLWDGKSGGGEKFAAPLLSERFAATHFLPASAPGEPVAVAFAASGKSFVTEGNEPLLQQAERAGLKPKFGCRIGICASCQCVKKSGVVENLQTGEISSAPNQLIRLCVSAARSDIALDL
jgi:ferredoxin-NADP reductase